MNAVDDAGLVKLSGHPEQFLQLFLAQMIEHPRVHHVGGETFRVLSETKIGQPLGADPSMAQLSNARISNQIRMSVFFYS